MQNLNFYFSDLYWYFYFCVFFKSRAEFPERNMFIVFTQYGITIHGIKNTTIRISSPNQHPRVLSENFSSFIIIINNFIVNINNRIRKLFVL